ncbi:hypothetical protein NDU88_002421 [Pleurodeles waltl]|uniref:Uncharacterized protein n=1 Tax=Pleurodeles waltl TaxID=8319 RepID=A0AAV7VCT4_PLEWA|nr:hypothetical protein NDU88_002421 [Pleurodeles waltl]
MGSTDLPESIDEVGLEDFGYDPVLVMKSHSASKRWTALMIGLVQRIGWARKYLRPKASVCVSVPSSETFSGEIDGAEDNPPKRPQSKRTDLSEKIYNTQSEKRDLLHKAKRAL